MNPLFNLFGQNYNQNGFPFAIIQQFNQFRSTFQGDPKQQVQNLLNSGQMTQEQFTQLSSMARDFEKLINH